MGYVFKSPFSLLLVELGKDLRERLSKKFSLR
jgi:hypothetical protein